MFANVIALSEVTILRCKCLQTLSLFSTITGFTFQSEEQTMWAKQKVERQMPNRCRSTHQRTSINIMENTFQGKNLWLFVVCLSAHTTMCRFPLWVPSAFHFPLNQLIKPVSNTPRPNLGCFSQDKKCDKKCLFISSSMVERCETYFQAEWMFKLSAVDQNSQFLRVPPHSSSSSLSLASLAASC